MIGAGIVALGAALPEAVRSNAFWDEGWRAAQDARSRRDLIGQVDHAVAVDPEVARHAHALREDPFRGARERRVLEPERAPSDLEAEAARAVIGARPPELLVVSSQLPDHPSPLNHGLVAHKLGLPARTTAMTLDTGCASFLTGVATASRLVASGAYESAVVVASAVMSRIQDTRDSSAPLVGDGAVAARIEATPGGGLIDDEVHTRGEWHGGVRLAPSASDAPWYRGDVHRGALVAVRGEPAASHQMSAFAATRCREVCAPLLARNGLSGKDIDFFALAQPTAWFAPAMAEALGIDADKVLPPEAHFARFGHLMAASVGLNLHLAAQQGRLRPGDLVLAYSPGAGFTQAAQLIRWAYEP